MYTLENKQIRQGELYWDITQLYIREIEFMTQMCVKNLKSQVH